MPQYDYRCSKGHISTSIVPISQHTDHIRCKAKGCRRKAEQFLMKPPHPHSGKLFWTGEEAYGKKKIRSDEHRADLEASMVEGALSHEQMDEFALS